MVGYTTVEATLGEKVIPGLLDHYLAKAAWDGAMLPEPADPNQPDNFWEPVRRDLGSHGNSTNWREASAPSLGNETSQRPVGGLLLAGAGLVLSSRNRPPRKTGALSRKEAGD